MNEVCENRILYKYSANLGYYNEHLSNEARTYIKSIRNKTINLNNFIRSRNYLIVIYVYGVHCVVISPHFFPISFYLINKKVQRYFTEWDSLSYSTIYSFFNISYHMQKIRNDDSSNTYFDYNTKSLWVCVDQIMSKKLFYTDPYYSSKIKDIFGYGGFCHYLAVFYDIKNNLDNHVDIMCFTIKRSRNMYLLVM